MKRIEILNLSFPVLIYNKIDKDTLQNFIEVFLKTRQSTLGENGLITINNPQTYTACVDGLVCSKIDR